MNKSILFVATLMVLLCVSVQGFRSHSDSSMWGTQKADLADPASDELADLGDEEDDAGINAAIAAENDMESDEDGEESPAQAAEETEEEEDSESESSELSSKLLANANRPATPTTPTNTGFKHLVHLAREAIHPHTTHQQVKDHLASLLTKAKELAAKINATHHQIKHDEHFVHKNHKSADAKVLQEVAEKKKVIHSDRARNKLRRKEEEIILAKIVAHFKWLEHALHKAKKKATGNPTEETKLSHELHHLKKEEAKFKAEFLRGRLGANQRGGHSGGGHKDKLKKLKGELHAAHEKLKKLEANKTPKDATAHANHIKTLKKKIHHLKKEIARLEEEHKKHHKHHKKGAEKKKKHHHHHKDGDKKKKHHHHHKDGDKKKKHHHHHKDGDKKKKHHHHHHRPTPALTPAATAAPAPAPASIATGVAALASASEAAAPLAPNANAKPGTNFNKAEITWQDAVIMD